MAWLRSPVFYGIVLLSLGALLRIALAFPAPTRPMNAEDLRRAIAFQRAEQPILKLAPRYRPYAFAFIFAGSAADVEAIKQAIDAELAAAEAVRRHGLAGLPEYTGERLAAADIALMALGAALVFRSLAFVLALAFGAGVFHQLLVQAGKLTGAPSEFYLASILAALLWAVLFWVLRAFYEGRLRFRT